MTLHEALDRQGIGSTESEIPGKRRLYLRVNGRDLGLFSAREAWAGLANGFLIYRDESLTDGR